MEFDALYLFHFIPTHVKSWHYSEDTFLQDYGAEIKTNMAPTWSLGEMYWWLEVNIRENLAVEFSIEPLKGTASGNSALVFLCGEKKVPNDVTCSTPSNGTRTGPCVISDLCCKNTAL